MQIKRFNWFRKATSWDFAQARQAQTKRSVEGVAESSAAASAAFLRAQNGLTDGLATIAAHRLIQRREAELKAKASALNKLV